VTPEVEATPVVEATPTVQDEETMVRNLVREFGAKLQMVSLSAPKDILFQSMRDNYGDYITATLLEKWRSDPQKALGRMVSSPWPDRIDILSMEKTSESVFIVSGEIIEITSVEKMNGGFVAKRPIILIVRKINNRWLIDEAMAGSYSAPQSIEYQNTQYGFDFSLPDSWRGYTIVTDRWEGLSISDGPAIGDSKIVERGPLISIRHPEWTEQDKRQDIPIMIFTRSQWNALQKEKFHIGAAPIGPTELGRNNKYVFALPARYNFAFPTGFEEVQEILEGKPLQPFNISN
jgi:hypothetical protein